MSRCAGAVAWASGSGTRPGDCSAEQAFAFHPVQPADLLIAEAALIGGQWLPAASGQTVAVTNPATGAVIGTVPDVSGAETAAAIAFLASDECPFMTGAEMLVDGAMMAIHPGF